MNASEENRKFVGANAQSAASTAYRGLRICYETAVRGLQARIEKMQNAGYSPEIIARAIHAERRQLAALFKERTAEPLRSQLYRRTLSVYSDPIGPTIETLRNKGKSWDDIIESATRPGPLPSMK